MQHSGAQGAYGGFGAQRPAPPPAPGARSAQGPAQRQPHPQPQAPPPRPQTQVPPRTQVPQPQPTHPHSQPPHPPAPAPQPPQPPHQPHQPPRQHTRPLPAQPPAAPAPPSGTPPQPAGGAPTGESTGHVKLPPGAPVQVPAPGASPAQLDATRAAVAVLLIGPAGAGKTTVARYWADHRAVPTAHISLDDVREWVRSGFADPQTGWNDNSEAQYRLARRTCGFAARNFLANGISCILDDAVFPDWPVIGLGGWKRHVGPGLIPVVLLPGLDIVLERNAQRTGNRRLADEEVAHIHGRMAGWYSSGLPIIDNSRQDVASTAQMLDNVVARSLASPVSW
ncbi:AAA family ATPase [Streptomyces spirodelae]|uniref:AAA family ATPase n=1 Tax=Streptomyces spirodelae TaxID=2812904 RepID=A0ABS3X1A7_9ACTN|nr:AAA family ATPase [Streptomyces spirodelae]MBO8189162.1 AAA family ATPase [Streptomyces spirodelae]